MTAPPADDPSIRPAARSDPSNPELDLVHKTLGRYRVLERLGAGGMGVVFRAHDQRLEREVALKVLPAGALEDEAARQRLRKEALSLSKLNHPNIAMVFDFDTLEGSDVLVMELIPGQTLDGKIRDGPVSIAEIQKLGVQLASGLAAAHEQRVVHRDLKPGNLMVTPKGDLKILDFGLAKPFSRSDDDLTRSFGETGAFAGTLPYMAPEQVLGGQPDPRTDIHAAGVILYEMATGRRPFEERDGGRLTDAILHRDPAPPSRARTDLPPALEQIIQRCMEKDVARRYQTAVELAADLSTMQAPARLPRAVGEKASIARRWVLALALAAVLAVIFGLTWPRLPIHGDQAANSIAVLPLVSQDERQDAYDIADGMTDSLINSLALIPSLRVISHASVFQYRSRVVDPRTAGRELGVKAVLTGRVAQRGGNLTVNLELSNADDGRHLWGQQYTRPVGEVMALQEEAAAAVADALRLPAGEQRRLSNPATSNTDAQQLYLAGRYYFFKEGREDVLKARELYRQAIDKDPNFALAYRGLGDTYIWMAMEGFQPFTEVNRETTEAFRRARQLNDSLPEVHAGLGIHALTEWDWATAEAELQRALQINPNLYESHQLYSLYLRTMRHFPEAIRQARLAVELNPLSMPARSHLALTLYYAGQYDAAREEYRKLARDYPQFAGAHAGLYAVLMKQGSRKEALAEWAKAYELQGDLETARALAQSDADSGWQAVQRRVYLREIEGLKEAARKEKEYVSPTEFAYRYALLSEKDEAFRWLEKAYAEHAPDLLNLGVDPDYENLRQDARFAGLLTRLHLPR